jgi:hypothetical protein
MNCRKLLNSNDWKTHGGVFPGIGTRSQYFYVPALPPRYQLNAG